MDYMKNSEPYVIIFDLDGTLLNSAEGVLNAVRYAFEKLSIPIPSYKEQMRIIGPPLIYSFTNYFGLDEETAGKAIALFGEYYVNKGIYECELYNGVIDMLTELKAAGKNICIATSKPSRSANLVIDQLKLRPFLTSCRMNEEDHASGTKKEIIEAVMQDCGCQMRDAVMIGDTRFDADGAKEAGIRFVGVLYGFGTREEMEAQGGGCFVDTVGELKQLLLGL